MQVEKDLENETVIDAEVVTEKVTLKDKLLVKPLTIAVAVLATSIIISKCFSSSEEETFNQTKEVA